MNKLLFRKLVMAFLVAFVPALVTAWKGLAAEPDFHFTSAIGISLVVGALGVGLRAVLALGPINLVESDAQHTVVGANVGGGGGK